MEESFDQTCQLLQKAWLVTNEDKGFYGMLSKIKELEVVI
jgi:hypothetical protein